VPAQQTKKNLTFVHLDVFANKQLEGNQLAVFPDVKQNLSRDDMQMVAREMNLSETTFVFRREKQVEEEKGIRTRIFTVKEELPFAGHPTLGTAWVLSKGLEKEVILDLNVDRVPVRFEKRGKNLFGEMTQRDPNWGMEHDPKKVAAALGVDVSDLDSGKPIETVSTGNPFAIVTFRSLDHLRNLRPDGGKMEEYLKGTDAKFFYLICNETVNPRADLHARMIFYGGEDPATGSAAGPTAAWMLKHGLAKAEESVIIEQGLEISRPSHIYVRSGGTREIPASVRVGGYCFDAIKGELVMSR
jgi:trans-2,3-dihydro-3-hydroxyanthranilate isomerase